MQDDQTKPAHSLTVSVETSLALSKFPASTSQVHFLRDYLVLSFRLEYGGRSASVRLPPYGSYLTTKYVSGHDPVVKAVMRVMFGRTRVRLTASQRAELSHNIHNVHKRISAAAASASKKKAYVRRFESILQRSKRTASAAAVKEAIKAHIKVLRLSDVVEAFHDASRESVVSEVMAS